MRTKWSKKREKLGQPGAAGGKADPIFDIIDSVESSKELTNPTFLGDSLDDYDDDDDSTYDDTTDMPTSGNTNLYFEAHKPVFFNKNLYFLKTYTNRLPLPHFITRIFITSIVIQLLSEDVNGTLCSTTYKVHI